MDFEFNGRAKVLAVIFVLLLLFAAWLLFIRDGEEEAAPAPAEPPSGRLTEPQAAQIKLQIREARQELAAFSSAGQGCVSRFPSASEVSARRACNRQAYQGVDPSLASLLESLNLAHGTVSGACLDSLVPYRESISEIRRGAADFYKANVDEDSAAANAAAAELSRAVSRQQSLVEEFSLQCAPFETSLL